MNKSLQELINLYIYELDNRPICQIHFKGRLDPYDVCKLDELLGDILEICRIKDSIDFHEVLNDRREYDGYSYIDGKRYLKVAVVIVYNNIDDYEDSMLDKVVSDLLNDWEYEETLIYNKVHDLLETLENNKVGLTKDILEQFLGTNGYYVPQYTIRKLKKLPQKPLGEDVVWMKYAAKVNIFEKNQKQRYVYDYICDNMEEVFLALVHYISSRKYYLSKCEVCGRYFIPWKRKDEKYCSIIRGQNQDSCKEIGRRHVRKMRLQNDRVTKKYNSVYTNITNKMRANKYSDDNSQKMLWDKREKLTKEFRERKKTLNTVEMLQWLDKFNGTV